MATTIQDDPSGDRGNADGQFAVEHNLRLDGGSRLVVRGEMDMASELEFEEALRRVETTAVPECIEFDLSEVSFIDSSGIRMLVEARRRADRDQRRLILSNLQPSVARVLDLAGITSRFIVL